MTNRVLLTGGAGYVGSVCCERLLDRGYDVIIIDDLSAGHMAAVPSAAKFYRMDIGDAPRLAELLRDMPVDAVFHFAAKALIPESVTNPAIFFKVNLSSSLSMLDVVMRSGVQKFVFSSTAAVYGDPIKTPIDEEHPTCPVNSYGESKLCFEKVLRWYARAYSLSAVAFRYFNACGASPSAGENHQPETHIIPLLFEAALGERAHFTIYGDDWPTPDGTCLRDYVHVLDIAEAHIMALALMSVPGFEAYNIGTGTSCSVRKVLRTVERVIGMQIPTEIGARRPGDPAVLQANPDKLMRKLSWKPQHSTLDNIISTAWAWKQRALPGSSGDRIAIST